MPERVLLYLPRLNLRDLKGRTRPKVRILSGLRGSGIRTLNRYEYAIACLWYLKIYI
jgi:hypothetical protein